VTRTRVGEYGSGDGEPEDLGVWLEAGFVQADAEIWRQWRFTLAEAAAWRREGVSDGLTAAQWQTAGASPETVGDWLGEGIDAAEAVRWHEFGYTLEAARTEKRKGIDPQQAFAQQHPQIRNVVTTRMSRPSGRFGMALPGGMLSKFQSGVDPRVMHTYMQHQWFDQDALAWATQGVEAHDAYIWFELGLTPHEAGRLTMQGRDPGDAIREWWSAGIPFEELADWLGAGLTASEAVEQRSRGITVEQAAVLRALRQEDQAGQRRDPLPPEVLGRRGPPRRQPIGPPPKNEDAARSEIGEAFCGMLTANADGELPTVDGGSNLGGCLEQARLRHGIGEVTQPATVTADFVRFVNDHEARVSFTIVITAPMTMNLAGRPGRAVLVDGVWKVARETFCEFMQFAGVECPPRP
jgi:hypothetical protein